MQLRAFLPFRLARLAAKTTAASRGLATDLQSKLIRQQ